MEPSEVDWSTEEKAVEILSLVEGEVGEARFGGGWIDRADPARHRLGVAVVDPSQADVDSIHREARERHWSVSVSIVRYARVELIGLVESLSHTELPGDACVGIGWDAKMNAVVADLRRIDEATIAFLRARVPHDALVVVVQPGAYWLALEAE